MAAADPRADLTIPLLTAEPQLVLEIESNGSNGEDQNPFEFLGVGPLSLPPPSPIDPFRNNTPSIEGLYEYLKIVVCIPIALARLVLFGLCLLVGFIVTKFALQGWKDKQNPMPKWRCRLMWVTRMCARCILFSFGYQWIRRVGRPASREVAPIVVSNHVSYIEPIFFFYELFPTIVASESHDAIPFVGTIIRAMQRKASCDGFPRLLLFPEGTTTNGKVLISFQLGAFIPGYTIQPVVVRYPHVHFDQSWGNISLMKLMFRMFTQFHNFMEVEFLPVITPLDNKKENAGQFAERTSFAISSALNVVQTSHSYGDLMLLTRASELRQHETSSYLVEMAWVDSTFNINTLEALEFLDKFLAMNPDSSGRVKIHDFSRILRLESCSLSEKIFAFLDVENFGSITFRQFLLGSAHILKLPLFQQACSAAFDGCDHEAKGYITKEQFGEAICSAVPHMNGKCVSDLFDLLDTDKDGAVSSGDFMACLRRNPLLIALFACNTTLMGGKLEVV